MIPKTLLVTGGAGFIGSALIRYLVNDTDNEVINLDKLTYAGNLENLTAIEAAPGYRFVRGDITDRPFVKQLMVDEQIDTVVNFAAE